MCPRTKAIDLMLSLRPSWNAAAVDAVGRARGTLAIWDPYFIKAKAYKFFGGILLSGQVRGCKEKINIINLYASCYNRSTFWDRIEAYSILGIQNLIVAGDFNSTLLMD